MREFCIISFWFIWPFFIASGQDAPFTFAGNTISRDTTVTVSVTVSAFYNISGNGIVLKYDSTVGEVTAVNKGPEIPGGLDFNASEPGKVIIGWYCWPPLSLPDSSVLYNITFTRMNSGTTDLIFEDSSNECYYSDSSFTTMNDFPADHFYYNGSLTFVSAGISHEKIPGLKVFPNPCHDSFFVTTGMIPDIELEASLFTLSGKLVIDHQISSSGNNLEIKTGSLKCGEYILRLSGNGIVNTCKIMISE